MPSNNSGLCFLILIGCQVPLSVKLQFFNLWNVWILVQSVLLGKHIILSIISIDIRFAIIDLLYRWNLFVYIPLFKLNFSILLFRMPMQQTNKRHDIWHGTWDSDRGHTGDLVRQGDRGRTGLLHHPIHRGRIRLHIPHPLSRVLWY